MIKIIISMVIILILQLLIPYWWWVMIVPFAIALTGENSILRGARLGFASAGLLWLLTSTFFYLTGSQVIAERIAHMFKLNYGWMMIIVSALVGAISGGIAGGAGSALRSIIMPKKRINDSPPAPVSGKRNG